MRQQDGRTNTISIPEGHDRTLALFGSALVVTFSCSYLQQDHARNLLGFHEKQRNFAHDWEHVRSPLGRVRHLPTIKSPE